MKENTHAGKTARILYDLTVIFIKWQTIKYDVQNCTMISMEDQSFSAIIKRL